MHIIHVAPICGDLSVGLTYSIPSLIEGQHQLGADCVLICSSSKKPNFQGLSFPVRWLKKMGQDELSELFSCAALVVFHSTYICSHMRIAQRLTRMGIPYVIVPRGGLTRASAKRSHWKKTLADRLFFRRYVTAARALHCLTEGEKEGSKHWHRSIFVVGNGVDLPQVGSARSQRNTNELVAIYIGRLSIYHKGLDLLLEGFAQFFQSRPESKTKLRLYGPDDRGSALKLRSTIDQLGLGHNVSLHDAVFGEAKRDILQSADFFCQTSRFEGHPMGVLEALSYGVPCLLTTGTNYAEEVRVAGAGAAVAPTPTSIASGFEALAISRSKLEEMSEAARSLSKQNTWVKVAEDTLSAYQRLLEE